MKNTRVARRYALALMLVAKDQGVIDRVSDDLNLIRGAIAGSREFRLLLASPVVSTGKKNSVLKAIFGKNIHLITAQFLELMATKRRESIIADMVEQFQVYRDEKLGIVNVEVATAVGLEGSQEKKLKERLEEVTGKNVRLHLKVDAGIKGGLVVKIGDTVLDSSVKRHLEILHERFVHGAAA